MAVNRNLGDEVTSSGTISYAHMSISPMFRKRTIVPLRFGAILLVILGLLTVPSLQARIGGEAAQVRTSKVAGQFYPEEPD